MPLQTIPLLPFSHWSKKDNSVSTSDYLQRHPEVNLVVTDIRMPKFDGLELISRIRKDNGTIPIIIISGYSCFSILRKDLLFFIKKEDIDDKFLKKQVQKILWKFNPGLEICAGIYHSDHNDTLKNAFYSGISVLTHFLLKGSHTHISRSNFVMIKKYRPPAISII